MSTKSSNTEYNRKCPKCDGVLYYSSKSSLNLAIRENKVCRSCTKVGKVLQKSHPEMIDRVCEHCDKTFEIAWKYRKQRFCSTQCVHIWRTETAWITTKCNHCGNSFKQRKKENKMFCCVQCSLKSDYKKNKLREWANSCNNHWNKKSVQDKVKNTKLKRYGSSTYNNMKQTIQTNIKKYGVPYAVYLPQVKSNGKSISKGQRRLYEDIKNTHVDAKIEYYLDDVGKSVDIYIPSKNIIVEYFGDYWHCNPKKYDKNYYHTQVHKTAEEIWKSDKERLKLFEKKGYTVILIWESDLKNGYLWKYE